MKRIPVEGEKRIPSVYIAGPDVFFEDAAERKNQATDIARRFGLFALNPMDNEIDMSLSPREVSREIFLCNRAMIDQCDYVVANLEPFRGMEPDSGTIWEVGYALGTGKRVIGYRQDTRPMVDQIRSMSNVTEDGHRVVDTNGHAIENFGNALNLMIQESIDYLVTGSLEDALALVRELELGVEKLPVLAHKKPMVSPLPF